MLKRLRRKRYRKTTHKSSRLSGVHKPLLISIISLSLFGLIAVFNSSVVIGFRDFADKYHFIKSQAGFLLIGISLMLILSKINYRIWYKLSVPLLVVVLLLLVAVFLPGIGIKAQGAQRWLNIGFFVLQPTEVAKLVLVLYLSAWFSYKEKGRFRPFLVLLGIVMGLVILQPDLGTAIIIIAMALVLYFIGGASIWHFFIFLPLMLLTVVILAMAAPYRLARITAFLNPMSDPLGASYHIRQILIALGSGGIFGLGLGKSRQKYTYLPEANTDSIFAIIAEELGFIITVLFIGIFIYITYLGFKIAQSAPDRFGKLLASGITAWFAIQTLINLAAMVALIPLTGVPLPLISYGGSNLIAMLAGMGILLNISRYSLE